MKFFAVWLIVEVLGNWGADGFARGRRCILRKSI